MDTTTDLPDAVDKRKEIVTSIRNKGFVEPHEQEILRKIFVDNYQVPSDEPKYDGDEIAFFFIAKSPGYNSYCIHIALKSGETSTISPKNLRKVPKEPGQSLVPQRNAFRNEIQDQIKSHIEEHKAEYVKGMEVDHNPPFCELRDGFLTERKISLQDVKVKRENGLDLFEEEDLRKRWQKFHQTHSKLELVTKKANRERWIKYLKDKGNTIESNQYEALAIPNE